MFWQHISQINKNTRPHAFNLPHFIHRKLLGPNGWRWSEWRAAAQLTEEWRPAVQMSGPIIPLGVKQGLVWVRPLCPSWQNRSLRFLAAETLWEKKKKKMQTEALWGRRSQPTASPPAGRPLKEPHCFDPTFFLFAGTIRRKWWAKGLIKCPGIKVRVQMTVRSLYYRIYG